jgi:hypothetical protein
VRINAGTVSLPREATPERHLVMAQGVVEDLKREREAAGHP